MRTTILALVLALAACSPAPASGPATATTTSDMPLRRSLCVQIAEAGQLVLPAKGEPAPVWTVDALDEQAEALAASAWTTDELSTLAVRVRLDGDARTGKDARLAPVLSLLRAGKFDEASAAFRSDDK